MRKRDLLGVGPASDNLQLPVFTLDDTDVFVGIVEEADRNQHFRQEPYLTRVSSGPIVDPVVLYFNQLSALRSLLDRTSRKVVGYTESEASRSLSRELVHLSPKRPMSICVLTEAYWNTEDESRQRADLSLTEWMRSGLVSGYVIDGDGSDLSGSRLLLPSQTLGSQILSVPSHDSDWSLIGRCPVGSAAFLRSFEQIASTISLA